MSDDLSKAIEQAVTHGRKAAEQFFVRELKSKDRGKFEVIIGSAASAMIAAAYATALEKSPMAGELFLTGLMYQLQSDFKSLGVDINISVVRKDAK